MASINDLKYINEASIVAQNSPCYNQHGCVIVKNGKIVSSGYNNYNISQNSLSSTTTHAEIDALTKYMKLNRIDSKGIYPKGNKLQIQQETQ
jgi:deoxycytidylate deaminase